jgi:hypothetical protein
MHATGFTMVKPKRPGGKSLSPLKPVIGAFLDLPLGPGFAAFPDLIDKDSVEKSILQLRQTFYFAALKVVTKSDWNRYIHFGFQQFANPLDSPSVLIRKRKQKLTFVSSDTSVYMKKPMQS